MTTIGSAVQSLAHVSQPFVNFLGNKAASLWGQGLAKRLDELDGEAQAFYPERVTTLAHLIAGKGFPSQDSAGIDVAAFLASTGFKLRYRDRNDTSFPRAVNDHLFRMELGYATLFDFPHGSYGKVPPMMLNLVSFDPGLGWVANRAVKGLVGNAPAKRNDDPVSYMRDLYSRILEEQDAAEIILPMVHHALETIRKTAHGIPVNSMQLALMSKGMEVGEKDGTIRIRDEDHYLLRRSVEVRSVDGKSSTLVQAELLLKELNSFIRSTSPEERGVEKGTTTYRGKLKYLKAAMEHPFAARAILKVLLGIASPVLIKSERRSQVSRSIYNIVDTFLREGNSAYLETFIRNRQPINREPQYMDDVTAPERANAWQNTFTTPAGHTITYAEARRALHQFFKHETNLRSRKGSVQLLTVLGIPLNVDDPEGVLNRLPSDPFYMLSSHESFLDILVLVALFKDVTHAFVTRANLTYLTAGIGVLLMGKFDPLITRMSEDMSSDERRRIYEYTMKDYERAVVDDGASLFMFPQGTRSRTGLWRDSREPGDGVLEARYRRSATTTLGLAKKNASQALAVHLEHTGNALMYGRGLLGDILGLKKYKFLTGVARKRVPVLNPQYIRGVRAHIGPLTAVEDAADTAERFIAFHNAVEKKRDQK